MIKVKSVETKEFVSKFIEPSVTEASITKVESFQASTGTYGLRIHFETAPVEGLDGAGRTATQDMYLSEKALPYTIGRLRRISDALGVKEAFDNISAEESEFGNILNPLLAGKVARWLFEGQEIPGKEGKPNWYKAQLYSGFNFVEPIKIPSSESRLSFNADQHLKPVRTVDTNAGSIVNHEKVDTTGMY